MYLKTSTQAQRESILLIGGRMPRRLHIGGRYKHPDWEIFGMASIHALENVVDHEGNAKDLSRFPDCTFAAVYASHILEHFDYENEINETLSEWYRVLMPGGNFYVSVPDMDVLAALFLEKDKLSLDERFFVMRMLFGGHLDKHDYHFTGMNEEFLHRFLSGAGFINIKKVDTFGIFQDSSTTVYKGTPISVNLIAEKPL